MRAAVIILGLMIGGLIGLVLGFLLAVGVLSIPGVGPMIAAGSLATMLQIGVLGMLLGALLGGLFGFLIARGSAVRSRR
jgi:hypothetical protein